MGLGEWGRGREEGEKGTVDGKKRQREEDRDSK